MRLMKQIPSIGIALALFATTACGQQDITGVTTPVDSLVPASPSSVGIDPAAVDRLVDRIRSGVYRDIHSLLVVRYGKLVVEEYFNGWPADSIHTMQSVSKSVASALVGIGIEQGVFAGVDERVLDFFPQWADSLDGDPRRGRITIEDILTMRTGTDYREGFDGSPHDQLNSLATGWDRFWLERPMVTEPGTHFQYDSGGVITLSSLFKYRTGEHVIGFSREHLMRPLGITGERWYVNQEGHPHLGGGLLMRSRDMARFGQMFLQGGLWGDRQIVPHDWVERSLSRHVTFDPPRGRFVGYGYLWWILPPDPRTGGASIYAAVGFMGQYIFVIPEHEMVVAVTAAALNGADMNRPVEFLYSDLLPGVMDGPNR
jgi:CubicO group peptidase (beta-lactamase class C family)